MPQGEELPVRTVAVHGHDRAFVDVGEGQPLLLLHGIGSDLQTWDRAIPALVRRGFRVIAPDFLGHGRSAKPRADYSLGGFANGMRDLLTILGLERVTVVGHSLGGGVAMQFAYQFPERAERVALVSAGGLGRSVNPVLRALTLPGAGPALAVGTVPPARALARPVLQALRRTGLPATTDLAEFATVHAGLATGASRSAFLHVLRAAVDWRGQVVTMIDRAYLAEEMPVLVIWGRKDTVIPAKHAEAAGTVFPGARVEVFDDSGHFPHRDEPERFVETLAEFVATTEPSQLERAEWRRLLISGRRARRTTGSPRRSSRRTGTAARTSDRSR